MKGPGDGSSWREEIQAAFDRGEEVCLTALLRSRLAPRVVTPEQELMFGFHEDEERELKAEFLRRIAPRGAGQRPA